MADVKSSACKAAPPSNAARHSPYNSSLQEGRGDRTQERVGCNHRHFCPIDRSVMVAFICAESEASRVHMSTFCVPFIHHDLHLNASVSKRGEPCCALKLDDQSTVPYYGT